LLFYESSPGHAINIVQLLIINFLSLDLGGGLAKTDTPTYMQKKILMLVLGLDVGFGTNASLYC
jgi:hypothetical protein